MLPIINELRALCITASIGSINECNYHLPLHSRHIFVTRVIKINFHFFRLHGAKFCNVHSEVGYVLVLGTSWFGYELAWYDLVRVRVD